MTDLPDNDATADGQWLTLPSAAAYLSISERTLTRRIASGHFRAERFDGRVRVWLPNSNGRVTTNPVGATVTVAEMTDTATELSATLGRAIELLKDSLERERGRADAERQRAEAAEARLETATAQMLTVEQHVAEVRETAAMYQERVRNLEEDNKRLSAQLALPAPTPEPISPPAPVEALRVQVEQLQARLEAPQAPWWAFWRRG